MKGPHFALESGADAGLQIDSVTHSPTTNLSKSKHFGYDY